LKSQHESDIEGYDDPNGSWVESVSHQPTELVPTKSSSEVRQNVETQYTEMNKRIERLEKEVQLLSKPFITKANLQASDQDIPLIAYVDPVKKSITSIQIDKSY
jgi:hypothetical protein